MLIRRLAGPITAIFLFQNCGSPNLGYDYTNQTAESGEAATANITVNASENLGQFNDYLFGAAQISDSASIVAKAAGYKVTQVRTHIGGIYLKKVHSLGETMIWARAAVRVGPVI